VRRKEKIKFALPFPKAHNRIVSTLHVPEKE
jgi:hypothetical protein